MKCDRVAIHAKFGGRCAYCGWEITSKGMQVDHVLARLRFGTDAEENLFPACASCNNWKHSWTVEEFRSELVAQPERLRKYSSQYRIAERFELVKQVHSVVVFWFESFQPDPGEKPPDGNTEAARPREGI